MTNGVLASLAVSDFLAGLVGIPLYLACNVTYNPSWCLSSAAFWRAEKFAKLRKERCLDDNKTCCSVASEWKVAVVFAGMLAVFLICWAPYTYGGRWNSGVITFVGRVFDVLLHKIHCLRHQPGAFRFRLTRFPLCPSRMFKVLSYLEEKRTGSWNNRYSRLKND